MCAPCETAVRSMPYTQPKVGDRLASQTCSACGSSLCLVSATDESRIAVRVERSTGAATFVTVRL